MPTDDHQHPDGPELIHRNRPNDHFVIIPNATLRNRGVSYLARGLLAEMLSRPPGWRVIADEMAAGSPGAGRRVVRAAFHELRAAGYLHKVIIHGDGGRFTTQIHVFSEPAQCGTSGCRDCTKPAEADVSAGRTDVPLTDGRSAVRHIEDIRTKDVSDRRLERRPRYAPTPRSEISPETQRRMDLEAVAGEARDHLNITTSGTVASSLLRTLTRSGKRPVNDITEYARAAFTRDPVMWRTLALDASINDGHIDDWVGDLLLGSNSMRALDPDYVVPLSENLEKLDWHYDFRDWDPAEFEPLDVAGSVPRACRP